MRRMSLILLACLAASPAMASQPSSEQETAQTSGEASQAPPESRQALLANDIESRIANGWDKYDAASTGYLSPGEFSIWMNDLRAENGNGPADDVIMRRAFLVADADKDTKISRNELTSFMMLRNRVKTSGR